MTALDLLRHLHTLGVILTPYPNGMLRYKAPQGVLTRALLDAMHQHKAALHAVMEAWSERAAIAEYGGGLGRVEAEHSAWQGVLGETAVGWVGEEQ